MASVKQRLDETAYVLDFLERSDRLRRLMLPTFDEVLQNYLVVPYASQDFGPIYTRSIGTSATSAKVGRKRNRSVLKDPETHQIIETITAQAMLLLLGSRDYITTVPVGRDDYDKGRLLARLLMAIMEQPGVWSTHYKLFKDAFLFGTSVIEIGWESRERFQYVQENGRLKQRNVLWRDRPLQRVKDIYDCYFDPSGSSIQDSVGFAHRFEVTVAEARRLAAARVYDATDVEKAIAVSQERTKGSTSDVRFPGQSRELPRSLDILTGFEYWGESPVRASDGMSNRVITLINGVRVRSKGNFFIDGNIPFKEVTVNPMVGRIYGLGVAEVVRFLQDATDSLLMVFNDAAELAVRGPLLIGNAWQGNEKQLRERSLGDIIRCADVKQVGTVPVDLGALQFAAGEYLRRKHIMREASGGQPVQNVLSEGDRMTATVGSEIVRLASQLVEGMVLIIERDSYPWIGRTLHSRLRQFLPEGGAVATLAGEQFEVPFEAIDIEADVRYTGSRQAGSKFQKFQQYNTFGTLVGSEAGERLALLFPEILIRIGRDGLEIPDAEDIVNRASERALAMKKLEVMQNASPPPAQAQPAGAGGEGTAGASGAAEISGEAVA